MKLHFGNWDFAWEVNRKVARAVLSGLGGGVWARGALSQPYTFDSMLGFAVLGLGILGRFELEAKLWRIAPKDCALKWIDSLGLQMFGPAGIDMVLRPVAPLHCAIVQA